LLTQQECLPFIDGLRHVKRIAQDAHMDLDIVRTSVRQLVFFHICDLVDLFSFTNMYAPTKRLDVLARDPRMKRECMEYILDDTPR
jgi:hypothetical protein